MKLFILRAAENVAAIYKSMPVQDGKDRWFDEDGEGHQAVTSLSEDNTWSAMLKTIPVGSVAVFEQTEIRKAD